MADNYINVTVTSKQNKRVTVSTQDPGFEVTATTDTGKFWANTAEKWATSDTIVENKDYSSKYYANKAKVSEENTSAYEKAVKETYNTFFIESGNITNEVRNAGQESINSIEASRLDAVDSINIVKNTAVDNINTTKTNILKDIEFVADGEKKEIEELIDNGKEELKESIGDVKVLTTLEIGDIGFTQMAIDESKGKRRVLNGQLIIQEQYPQFTNIIKNSVALNPDLACTEAEWQTAVTMSANGVCDKYVIDDEAGTIRLPKYPEYLDLSINTSAVSQTVSVYGTGKTLGLSDGTNNRGMFIASNSNINSHNTVGTAIGSSASASGLSAKVVGVTTDASKSGLTGKVTVPAVESEKIKGTYFIQVATGAETEDNIVNEIELNNPFSLLDYKFSEYELNNLSWLRSEGQYNSKAIYPAVYDLLLKIYNGTETKVGVSVKSTEVMKAFKEVGSTGYWWLISTEIPKIGQTVYDSLGKIVGYIDSITGTNGFTYFDIFAKTYFTAERNTGLDTTIPYTDYDFVLNTAEETFRLPLKVKQKFFNGGDVPVVGNGMALGLTDTARNFGLLTVSGQSAPWSSTNAYGANVGANISSDTPSSSKVVGVTTNSTKSGLVAKLSSTEVTGLYLYFYVGETVQNANLINAGRIQETYTTKSMVDGQWIHRSISLCSNSNVSSTLTTYDVSNYLPNDGYVYEVIGNLFLATGTASGNTVKIKMGTDIMGTRWVAGTQTRSASAVINITQCSMVVGNGRQIVVISDSTDVGKYSLQLTEYRRIGTNL